MIIKEIPFTLNSTTTLSKEWYGKNWASVYIIHNTREAYIGETLNLYNRINQHLANERRNKLKKVLVISDDDFNKSSILDIESKLIEYMAADASFKLQNSNSGIKNHNYYDKERYHMSFKVIWNELLKQGFVKHDLKTLENSDLFKFSPYKSLNTDQYAVVHEVLLNLINLIHHNEHGTFLINGEAGTGKTVLAMYIMKLLSDGTVFDFLFPESEDSFETANLDIDYVDKVNSLKFALVVPQVSLRKTLKNVARNIEGLKSSMIIGPSDVVKQEYDLLLVDESHRLKQRKGITNYGSFDNINNNLDLGKEGTEFDWILKSSKYQLFFYDSQQSIRPSDVPSSKFKELNNGMIYKYHLQSQMRSMGGNDYLKYIKEVFSDSPPEEKILFENYEFYLFDNISELRKRIEIKNDEEGLARLVAGYAWEWETKNIEYEAILRNDLYDIKIEEETFIWNSPSKEGWILSDKSINEVGSIHTTQGYDLNYVGVIIGEDIKFNPHTQKIEIDKDKYKDKKGKVSLESDEELKEYIINIYVTLMSRGIKGTYIYVCDYNLRNYLKKFVKHY